MILAAEQLSPNELLEMNKASLLAVVMHQGSVISHVSIMAKSMEVPTLVEVEIQKEWAVSYTHLMLGVILLVLAVYLIAGKRGKGNIKDEQ